MPHIIPVFFLLNAYILSVSHVGTAYAATLQTDGRRQYPGISLFLSLLLQFSLSGHFLLQPLILWMIELVRQLVEVRLRFGDIALTKHVRLHVFWRWSGWRGVDWDETMGVMFVAFWRQDFTCVKGQ
jgi:hypothetical protein